ncbi:MAG: hypothetical protein ABR985_07170, partial [Methanotrichaceae archaeon]
MNLTDYDLAEPIFIDANIFIDYSLPNPRYGKAVADFIEKVGLIAVLCGLIGRLQIRPSCLGNVMIAGFSNSIYRYHAHLHR